MCLSDRVVVIYQGKNPACEKGARAYSRPAKTFMASIIESPPLHFY